MIENYEKYLELIQGKIDGFFKKQEPYIFCHKGCSLCCEEGEYPWSYIEYKYLMIGYNKLDENLKEEIKKEIIKLKKEKENFNGIGVFLHKCPFLKNKTCMVYKYRGIICRTFGLLAQREGKKPTIPFCAKRGLNYSNVYDEERGCISNEKYINSKIEVEPLLYNVDYKFLTKETFSSAFGFDFGDKKPLLDWF